MHPFIPCTDKEEIELLKTLGCKSFDEFISFIPNNFKKNKVLGLNESLSELEVDQLLNSKFFYSLNNSNSACFLGGGAYDHFVPKVIDTLSSRSEFYTAYTPYQPEVSQGTLQYLYEFQSMICELSGMDVSNASLYDGASAVAEACSMALSISKNKIVALSKTLNPLYISVTQTYLSERDCEVVLLDEKDYRTDFDKVADNFACIVIQSPNYFGVLESWASAKSKINNLDTLLIAVADPSVLSIIESPGASGADIYVGEGQSLGNYLSFGGPYLGILATKDKYIRKIPGRIIAKTNDVDGKIGFSLTLQTREQHIRRENATSNICTNQSLLALRATIYLGLLGKTGLTEINKLCYKKAQHTYNQLINIECVRELHDRNFIKEFCVKVNVSAKTLKDKAENEGIFIGTIDGDDTDRIIQIAVTEKRTNADIEKLCNFLKLNNR